MSEIQHTAYNDEFFDEKQEGAFSSAEIIVPILLNIVKPKSIVDVGCGRGVWLKVFQDNGVSIIKGLDGAYIDQASLVIDPTCFSPVDLRNSIHINEQFDLAVCLEVAEHLPVDAGIRLVSILTAVAPVVLFSAAIPEQGGTDHVNEQWPEYWEALFAERGFHRLDPVRRHIMYDRRIDWWYRQNIFLYVSAKALAESAVLQYEKELVVKNPIEWVYVDTHKEFLSRFNTTPKLWRELQKSFKAALKRRLNGELGWFR